MSEMETHRGKLVPMDLPGDTLEDRAREACLKLCLEKEDYHDTWLDCLEDEGYKKVHINGDVIYEIQDEELDSYGFVEGTANDDGTIDYMISWYNGGASMDEVLAAALTKATGAPEKY